MSKLIIGIIIIVGIIFLVAMQQKGWEGIKAEPLDSAIQASQTIVDTGKDTYDKGKEIIDNFKNNEDSNTQDDETLTEVGRPLCLDDSSCNTLSQCSTEEPCSCIGGSCYK